MNLTYSQLLRGNRNFRNLFAGQLISELGNWFNYIAGLGLIRLVTDAAPEAAGILLLSRMLPWSLLAPFAGTLADRLSRRQIMFWTDIARAFLALVFLLVKTRDDLWIAYSGAVVLSVATAFFDGAKNASVPNIAGREGLLAGTALMFSSRFLLMAIGSALGGIASAYFGYEIAFLINAASFLVSAYSVWLIPEDATRANDTATREKEPFMSELREGMRYTLTNHFALTILLMNIVWAIGGGATFLSFEGLATKVFGSFDHGPDFIIAALMTANGIGLSVGMLVAHRVSSFVERIGVERGFIGWSLLVHGALFAIGGWMPTFWLTAVFVIASRIVVGAEYAVQETIFQRGLPDHIRGRITTLDRGAEITVFSLSNLAAGYSLTVISAQLLTTLSGLLAGSSGLIWFLRQKGAVTETVAGEKLSGAEGQP